MNQLDPACSGVNSAAPFVGRADESAGASRPRLAVPPTYHAPRYEARRAAIKRACHLVRTVPVFGRATETSKVAPLNQEQGPA